MRTLLFLLLALTVLTYSGCDDEEMVDPDCVQARWLGDYRGTATCNGTENPATISVSAIGLERIRIEYVQEEPGGGSSRTTYDPILPNGCELDQTSSGGGITSSVRATLAGDELVIREELTTSSSSFICDIRGTRD